MAIAKEIWEHIKAEYEVGIFEEKKIYSELARKYNVNRTTISKRAKKNKWIYGKNSHLAHQEKANITEFLEVEEKKSHLNHTEITAVKEKTEQLLQKEGINSNTIQMIKVMQKKIVSSMEYMQLEGLKPKEITSAMKDIHDMNNPKESQTNINIDNQNTQQSLEQTGISITFREKKNDK